MRDNDIDLQPDELSRDLGEALAAPLGPAILDGHGAGVDPASSRSRSTKAATHWPQQKASLSPEPDGRRLARCCARRKRAATARRERDELTPLHLLPFA